MRGFTLFLGLALCGSIAPAAAADESPYAGQESRRVKSLSAQDIDDLRHGRGWGLAKAAELNGMPGPAHLLEMRREIGLTPQQVAEIEALFRDMKASAVALGERLIALEADLNDAFARGDIGQKELEAKLEAIGAVRTQLRLTHLQTHLATPNILKPEQIAAYNRLRGYARDPCAGVPKGHDPAMWRKHSGC